MQQGGINVLSLFDGLSGGQIALKKLDIQVDNYFASEIDKYAMQVAKANFPNTIHIGDVTKVKAENLPKIQLIIGGSPCQGFSFAGKQLNFEDPRSKLFFEFVRLVKECKPEYFFLENVKMKKEYQDVISQHLGVEPIQINSALLSAQNRKRLYWFGKIENGVVTKVEIKQPEDKGILLKDILESDVDEKYFLSDVALNRINRREHYKPRFNPEKTGTLNTKNNSACLSVDNGTTLITVVNDRGALRETEKSMAIDANYYKGMDNHAQRSTVMCAASRGRNTEKAGLHTEQSLEPRFDGKTNCLTSVQKDKLVMQLNPSIESNGCQPYQQNRVYDSNGISPSLLAQMSSGTHAIKSGTKIRRLTPIECERLQTVPDNFTSSVSDTQRYRMLGNGWTVDVIAHIFNNLPYF